MVRWGVKCREQFAVFNRIAGKIFSVRVVYMYIINTSLLIISQQTGTCALRDTDRGLLRNQLGWTRTVGYGMV